MKPARATFAENFIPVDFARSQLRDRRMPAIGTTQSWTNAESPLGEIQSIPRCAADAVELNPTNQRLIDAALIDKILQQPAHRIIDNRRDDCTFEAEAPL